MSEQRFSPDNSGHVVSTTKRKAAIRQIQAAIRHFRCEEYECAISLAAAAEGVMPKSDAPHIFSTLKTVAGHADHDPNLVINWLKHPTGTDEMLLGEFEVACVIMRAISKLIAVHREGTEDMRAFGQWVFEASGLPVPETWQKRSG